MTALVLSARLHLASLPILLTAQMAKVGRALVTGDTGAQVEEAGPGGAAAPPEDSAAAASAAVTGGTGGQEAVKPQFFKALAGKGHQEFSSGRQQVTWRTHTHTRLRRSDRLYRWRLTCCGLLRDSVCAELVSG